MFSRLPLRAFLALLAPALAVAAEPEVKPAVPKAPSSGEHAQKPAAPAAPAATAAAAAKPACSECRTPGSRSAFFTAPAPRASPPTSAKQ